MHLQKINSFQIKEKKLEIKSTIVRIQNIPFYFETFSGEDKAKKSESLLKKRPSFFQASLGLSFTTSHR